MCLMDKRLIEMSPTPGGMLQATACRPKPVLPQGTEAAYLKVQRQRGHAASGFKLLRLHQHLRVGVQD